MRRDVAVHRLEEENLGWVGSHKLVVTLLHRLIRE